MNKLVLPISLMVFMVILVAAFSMKKKCMCVNGKCSKCNLFSFDHFFKKKETFATMTSEVPSFYTSNTTFPKLTDHKPTAGSPYWI